MAGRKIIHGVLKGLFTLEEQKTLEEKLIKQCFKEEKAKLYIDIIDMEIFNGANT